MAKIKAKDNDRKIKCPSCGAEKLIDRGFYKSDSIKYKSYDNRCFICKACLKNKCFSERGLFDKDLFKTVLKDDLDKPFYEKLFQQALQDEKDTLGKYLSLLNLSKKNNVFWKDGETEENSQGDKFKMEIKDEVMIYSTEWRGYYSQADIDYLNQYLSKLQDDFNIITTNHLDYAKKIGKASLAVDKAYEDMLTGNKDADKRYKDLQSIFDNLSKSAQFSENSRSANDVGISGISQVVDKIESKQWIYEVEEFPKDSLDHLLEQFANIGKSL